MQYVIVNGITNFCFRLLLKPYAEASARSKAKFLMSLTIGIDRSEGKGDARRDKDFRDSSGGMYADRMRQSRGS